MKDTTRSVIVAGIATVAVAFAAATLDSTVVPDSSGSRTPGGIGGDGDGGLLPIPRSGPTPGETVQVPFFTEILAVLAVIVALAFVGYVIVYWREALGIGLAVVALLGVFFVLFQILPWPVSLASPPALTPGNGSLLGGSGRATDTAQPSPPSRLVLLVLGLALVGAVVALVRTSDDERTDSSGTDEGRSANAAAVGRAAGRAADRLERDAAVGNDVYRTWREMTELLDVDDPDTSTPGEFAAAAVEAGLGREDVDELTRLFEDVRYGDTQPVDEHERHAITVFRRIEERYAEDGS